MIQTVIGSYADETPEVNFDAVVKNTIKRERKLLFLVEHQKE